MANFDDPTLDDGNYYWWLRSPGQDSTFASYAVSHYDEGTGGVVTIGNSVDDDRNMAVRPVLWISIQD